MQLLECYSNNIIISHICVLFSVCGDFRMIFKVKKMTFSTTENKTTVKGLHCNCKSFKEYKIRSRKPESNKKHVFFYIYTCIYILVGFIKQQNCTLSGVRK